MTKNFGQGLGKLNKVEAKLEKLKTDLEQELANILGYWTEHTVDREFGGFYSRISNENIVDTDAPKGLVLNARILWTFSAACNFTGNKAHLVIADRAFQYLIERFADKEYGGFYWSVDKMGKPIETKKQIYGIAFCCYAFSEYYRAGNKKQSLDLARDCYRWIEQYSFDWQKTGYLEAFNREWKPVPDLRLSFKDANEKKTMNTHLHILEAYTSLYQSCMDQELRRSILLLLENFTDHIISHGSGHLRLFFDEGWISKGDIISYGHDIEAAWLLPEAAEITGDKRWVEKIRRISLQLTKAAKEGVDTDGGLWYELENGNLTWQKHSWPQAEAMIGFFNAWQLSGKEEYLDQSIKSWQFVQQNILDKKNGEWFWGINGDYSVMKEADKAGFWKCPYHNSRACMEIIKRINSLN